jgi:hypothetical protein
MECLILLGVAPRATVGGDAAAQSLAEETFRCRVYNLSGEANLLTEGAE